MMTTRAETGHSAQDTWPSPIQVAGVTVLIGSLSAVYWGFLAWMMGFLG